MHLTGTHFVGFNNGCNKKAQNLLISKLLSAFYFFPSLSDPSYNNHSTARKVAVIV